MKAKKLNGNTVLLIITIALFFVMYAVGCVIYSNKGFTHLQTFLNILINNAGLLCITCGMTCVMLTGGIDISVGSLVAMDCMILAVGMERWNMNAVLLCILVLAIGIVFGVVQGFCVGYLNIQPFIVTMAGMFFARGMTAVISTAVPVSQKAPEFSELRFAHIRGNHAAIGVSLCGLPESPLREITLEDVTIAAEDPLREEYVEK